MADQRRPILQQASAVANTAEEARYRIDRDDAVARDSRIVALDAAATEIVRRLAVQPWRGGCFLRSGFAGAPSAIDQAQLWTLDGRALGLDEEVAAADAVIMIGTSAASATIAKQLGDVCAQHRVMSAALLVGDHAESELPLRAIRPNAMVLVHVRREEDLSDVLTALRV